MNAEKYGQKKKPRMGLYLFFYADFFNELSAGLRLTSFLLIRFHASKSKSVPDTEFLHSLLGQIIIQPFLICSTTGLAPHLKQFSQSMFFCILWLM
jgi:hypothetical protein